MPARYVRDFNTQALGAGVTAFIWYAFGAVPLHIAVASQRQTHSLLPTGR